MLRELKSFPHHRKVGPCVTRPPYRDGKRKRAVKVFTIADESMYLLIFGAPSIGLLKPLKERIQQFEEIQQISKVSHPEAEEFTETYLVKFRSVNLARNVKRRLDDSSFYGAFLHIVYAPEYETVAECRVKMHSYRRLNDSEAVAWRTHSMKGRWESSLNTEKTVVDLGVAEELSTSVSTATVATSKDAVLFGNPYAVPLHMVSASQNKRQMGDAIDDARNYWASRGLDFFHNSKRHSLQSTDPSPIPLLTAHSTNQLDRIPLATQQSPLRQSLPVPVPQQCLAPKWSHPPQLVSSTTKPVSRGLTDFIPRSVIKANRLFTGVLPSLKEGK